MRIALSLAATAWLFSLNSAAAASDMVPASEVELSYAVRGSLGAPLEDLDFIDASGRLTFLLNGGSLLLVGAFVVVAGRRQSSRARRETVRVVLPAP
jgi:hypothetical protein